MCLARRETARDDVAVPVLEPGNGKTKTGRFWTYVRDDRPSGSEESAAMWFAYSPDRKGEHPAGYLAKYAGILQADGYAGFNKLYEKARVMEAACWAHVRRKFHDLYRAHRSPIAKEALDRNGQDIRGRSPDERKEVRQARSRPLLEALQAWWNATLTTLSQKSDVAMAIPYALVPSMYSRMAASRPPMDRGSTWWSAERAAAIYALVGSALGLLPALASAECN